MRHLLIAITLASLFSPSHACAKDLIPIEEQAFLATTKYFMGGGTHVRKTSPAKHTITTPTKEYGFMSLGPSYFTLKARHTTLLPIPLALQKAGDKVFLNADSFQGNTLTGIYLVDNQKTVLKKIDFYEITPNKNDYTMTGTKQYHASLIIPHKPFDIMLTGIDKNSVAFSMKIPREHESLFKNVTKENLHKVADDMQKMKVTEKESREFLKKIKAWHLQKLNK